VEKYELKHKEYNAALKRARYISSKQEGKGIFFALSLDELVMHVVQEPLSIPPITTLPATPIYEDDEQNVAPVVTKIKREDVTSEVSATVTKEETTLEVAAKAATFSACVPMKKSKRNHLIAHLDPQLFRSTKC